MSRISSGLKWLSAACLALSLAGPVVAQEMAPDVLVKNVSEEVLDIVRKDKDIQSGNTRKAIELVEAKVLPHFNFVRMTQRAVAKNWRQANPAQQKVLIDEFRTLLVRTYSKALTEYRNQTIEYKPLKLAAGATEVTVQTLIKQSGKAPLDLNYDLDKGEQGWKVTDIMVGGVSLTTNYRDEFAREVGQGGIDGLIKSLQTKNKSGESSVPKK